MKHGDPRCLDPATHLPGFPLAAAKNKLGCVIDFFVSKAFMFALSSNSIFFLLFLCPLGGIATWAFRKKDLSVFVYFNK